MVSVVAVWVILGFMRGFYRMVWPALLAAFIGLLSIKNTIGEGWFWVFLAFIIPVSTFAVVKDIQLSRERDRQDRLRNMP